MENIKISMRYAKAIYTFAKTENLLQEFMADLTKITNLISNTRELKLLINSPIIAQTKKINVFKEIFSNKIENITMNFIILLINKGRERYINDIFNCVTQLFNKENGIIECKIVSAFTLDDKTRTKIENFLMKMPIENKNTIKTDYSVDNNLIGGVLFQIEDTIYDATIKNQLKELKKTLTE